MKTLFNLATATLFLIACVCRGFCQQPVSYLGRYTGTADITTDGTELGKAKLVIDVTKYSSSDGSIQGKLTLTFSDGVTESGTFSGDVRKLGHAEGTLTGKTDYTLKLVPLRFQGDGIDIGVTWFHIDLARQENYGTFAHLIKVRSAGTGSTERPSKKPKAQITDLKKENEDLKREIEELKREIEELRKRVEELNSKHD